MKKLITIIGLCVVCGAASAQNYVAKNFINGFNLIISNNVTVTYGNTNVNWADSLMNLRWSNQTNYIPATFYGNGSLTANPEFADTVYWTNAIVNATAPTGNAWKDLPNVWVAKDGKVLDNLTLFGAIRGLDAGSTNNLTFTVTTLEPAPQSLFYSPARLGSGQYLNNNGTVLALPGTQSTTFSFTVIPGGLTAVTFKTNLPTAFIQGAGGFRLRTIVSASGGGGTLTNVIVDAFGIEGFVP